MAFLYVRSDEMWSLNASVAGTVDADYSAAWLCDGRPGRPIRGTSGSVSWTVTKTAASVSLIAVCNHNVDAARAIGITGDIAASLTVPTLPPDGIPLNPFVAVTPVSTDSLTVAVSSNTQTVIIGELVAGAYRTLERATRAGETDFSVEMVSLGLASEFDSIPPYDKGLTRRRLKGTNVYSAAEVANLQAWFLAQRAGTRPSLIVPNSAVNDAWLVQMTAFTYRPSGNVPGYSEVTLEFEEYPRSRW